MPEVLLVPNAVAVPAGYTAPPVGGGGDQLGALVDTSDATYLTVPTTGNVNGYRLTVRFPNPGLPAGSVIEAVQPTFRGSNSTGRGNYLALYQVSAATPDGVTHAASPAAITAQAGAGMIDASWNSTAAAADGTTWQACNPATFEVLVIAGTWASYGFSGWGSNNSTLVTQMRLKVTYKAPPTVTGIAPSGSTLLTQPVITWSFSDNQESYRVIVVGAAQVDGAGVAAGAAGFNPETVTGPLWDSGRVYSSASSARPANPMLPQGSYRVYVRAWSSPAAGQTVAAPWANAALTCTATHCVAPVVSVAANRTKAALVVTVAAGTGGGGYTAAGAHETQRWDARTSTWATVGGALGASGGSVADTTTGWRVAGRWRARGWYVRVSDGVVIHSPWVETTFTPPPLGQWWLRDPQDWTAGLRLQVSAWSGQLAKPQDVAYGLGAQAATVTHGGLKGTAHKLTVRIDNRAEREAFVALLRSGRTLSLLDVFGDAWPVQPGDQTTFSIEKRPARLGDRGPIAEAWIVELSLLEVD